MAAGMTQARTNTTWNSCNGPDLDLLQADMANRVKGREINQVYSTGEGSGVSGMGRMTFTPSRVIREGSRRTRWPAHWISCFTLDMLYHTH